MTTLPKKLAEMGSFKRQIILLFVVGSLLLAAAFAAYQVRTESAYLYRDSTDETISLAESLAAGSRSWVLANDLSGMQEVVYSFRSHPELRYAMVISPSGRVLAHTDVTQVGRFVSDEVSKTLIKSPPVDKVLIDDKSVSDIAAPITVGNRHVGWARVAQGREGIAGNLHKMMFSSALFVLMAVVLSLLAALFVANRLGYRIRYLMRVAEAVQAGDYATRANISGADEIARLANSLNHMLDVLARDEEQLRSASLYTRSLIEASLDPLVTISLDGKITDVNKATEVVTGRSRTDLLGTDFSDYFTEPDKARQGYQQVFLDGSVTDYPLSLRHCDGHVTDVMYNASIYRNEAGEVSGVFAAARDITERNRAEATRTQLAAIVESSSDAIIGKTPEGIISSWNRAAETIYGYSANEIIGLPITTLAPASRYAEISELLEKVRKGGTVVNHETERLRKDGALIQVALTLSPIRDASGNIAGISTIARDITERKRAEFVLRQSEEALKEAQRMAHVGSWYMDLATNEVVWSEVLYQMYGFDPAFPPPLYTESMKLFTPESWEKLSSSIARAVESGTPYELELEMVPKDGGRKWMLARGELVRDERGVPVRVRGVVMDITERKQSEIIQKQMNVRFTLASRAAHLGVWDWDIQKNELIWDDGMYELYGVKREDFAGAYEAWLSGLYPDDREASDKVSKQAQLGEREYDTEFRVVWPDGSIHYLKAYGQVVRDADGKPLRMTGVNYDITALKRMESQLSEREYQFRTLAENSPDVIVRYDKEGRRIYVNPEFERVNHLSAREVYGKNPLELSTELKPKADAFTEQLMAAMASGTVAKIDLSWMKEGRLVCWFVRVVPEFDADGKVVSALTIWSDISERKVAENELREKENFSQSLLRLSRGMERSQTYADVLNAAQDEVKKIIGYQSLWVYLLSDDEQYLKIIDARGDVSDTALSEEGTATLTIKGDRMLEEIVASKEIVLVEDARTDERVNKEIVASMGLRTIVNIPIMMFDRHLGCVGTGTFGDEGVRVPSSSEQKYLIAMASHMAVALDRIHLLEERRKAEMALRELNNDFVTLLENTGDFIYFKDKESRMRFCSQTLANITGHSSWREMIGKHDQEIFPLDTARIYYEEEQPIFQQGKPLLNKTDPYYDGQGKPGWVNTNKWPVFGDDKKTVVGIFGISRDITELKLAEDKVNELNRDLEQRVAERTAQLEAANKELESFSYSVSHDLRTPLRAIDGFSHILLDDYTDKLDVEGKRLLNVVRDNTQKMGRLIDDILAFSRTGRIAITLSDIDMERLAREVLAELPTAAPNGKLQVEIEHIPAATGDLAMMRQVFVNLLSNAIKFSANKDVPKIKVGGEIQGNEIVYFVKDNGAGFDMRFSEKLFGVFQRLHGVTEFEGTGIGLAIVKRIITRHGGRVWAEGKVNEGATIYFSIPLAVRN